jgi:hypothetical protein
LAQVVLLEFHQVLIQYFQLLHQLVEAEAQLELLYLVAVLAAEVVMILPILV